MQGRFLPYPPENFVALLNGGRKGRGEPWVYSTENGENLIFVHGRNLLKYILRQRHDLDRTLRRRYQRRAARERESVPQNHLAGRARSARPPEQQHGRGGMHPRPRAAGHGRLERRPQGLASGSMSSNQSGDCNARSARRNWLPLVRGEQECARSFVRFPFVRWRSGTQVLVG